MHMSLIHKLLCLLLLEMGFMGIYKELSLWGLFIFKTGLFYVDFFP